MKLIVTENYEEMSQQATEIIIKTFQSQPNGPNLPIHLIQYNKLVSNQ